MEVGPRSAARPILRRRFWASPEAAQGLCQPLRVSDDRSDGVIGTLHHPLQVVAAAPAVAPITTGITVLSARCARRYRQQDHHARNERRPNHGYIPS